MKQGHTYTKIILWLFLIAVVCYFGYYLHDANYEPLQTVTAVEYEAGSGSYTTGFVVRDETLIVSAYSITSVSVSEGERVSTGQVIGTGYQSTNAQGRQARIEELEHEKEQLGFAVSYSLDPSATADLEDQAQAHLQAFSRSVARRDMNACADRSATIKGLILRLSSSEGELNEIKQKIGYIDDELAALREESSSDTKPVSVSTGGYFSGAADGYEDLLSSKTLQTMTVAKLEELEPYEVSEHAIGRLIHGSTWYYVTAVDEDLVADLRPGDRVPVSFVSSIYRDLTMRVDRLGEPENGKRLLVLSCDKYMQQVTLLREQSADVVFSSCNGLRVPKEAIRVTDDRRHGVYVLEAGAAEWKYVDLLHDNGESYVVKLDKSSTDNLWPGDEIIITSEELYDGKVIQQ